MKLARVLGRELELNGVAYAVIGGLAASARGEGRFTRDIDVALLVDTGNTREVSANSVWCFAMASGLRGRK